jgi:hypothetical protein
VIDLIIHLKCDAPTCDRREKVILQSAISAPGLPALIASVGWAQFFCGSLLCPECRENGTELERLSKLRAREPAIVPDLGTPALPKVRRWLTDAEILAAQAAHPSKVAAADALGITYQAFYQRLRSINSKNGGHNRLNGVHPDPCLT